MLNPIAFNIGPLSVRWYGISYAIGVIFGIYIINYLNNNSKKYHRKKILKDIDEIYNIMFSFFIFGVILGGRLGYILFYNLEFYLSHPLKIFAIWEGGMSFHGGLFASLIVGLIYCKKHKIDYLALGDIAVIPGALALTFTRIANFINSELVGRVIENKNFLWMGIDYGDGVLRYPSQIFQSLSAFLLFIILFFIFKHNNKKGFVFFSYIILYGFFRIITEFWRQADEQIGLFFNFISMGQILSFIMILIGVFALFKINKKK